MYGGQWRTGTFFVQLSLGATVSWNLLSDHDDLAKDGRKRHRFIVEDEFSRPCQVLMAMCGHFAEGVVGPGSGCRHFWGWFNSIFNMVDANRIEEVGPDRAAAEWLLRCGAKVKWKGRGRHHE